MAQSPPVPEAKLKAHILAVLAENRVMTVATVRPDGWPQATIVGFVHDDLTLYFAVARTSQKFANIERDSRISIAMGWDAPKRIRGLSMAARAEPVSDLGEVKRVNDVILARYPGQTVFAPREASSVLLKAKPLIISLIDLVKEPGQPERLWVAAEADVHRLTDGG